MVNRADPELNRDTAVVQATRQGSQTIAATKSVSPEAATAASTTARGSASEALVHAGSTQT